MILFADTETNGFFRPTLPPYHPEQGRVVQLAAVLVDDNGEELQVLNTLIKPDGWTISSRLTEIHGITTAMCEENGILMSDALYRLHILIKSCEKVVFHNYAFDASMLLNEWKVYDAVPNIFSSLPFFCTMLHTTDLCQLPKTRGAGFKWPKLQEAHKHFFGHEFADAHDALADVRACKRIYFHIHTPVERRQESSLPGEVIVTDTIESAGL